MNLTAWLLAQPEPVTVERIREEFPDFYMGTPEAIDRKWTRDKQALLDAGIPIRFVHGDLDREDGYLIDAGAYYLPELGLSPEEWAVLWTAGLAAARMEGNPWGEDLQSALQKLAAAQGDLPSRAPDLVVRHGGGIGRRQLARILDDLGEAVRRRKRVSLEYTNNRLEMTKRDVDVYGFAWRRGEWLFAGYCHLRQALRVFYVDRVRKLKVSTRNPQQPDYSIPRGFDIRTFSRQQVWDYRDHEPKEAQVRFTGSLARIAAELLPGAKIEWQADGSRLARLAVRSLSALVRQALSFGPEAELVAPEEGHAMAREMLDRLASGFGREGAA